MHHMVAMLVRHTWLYAWIREANFNVKRLLRHIVLANLKAEGLHTILDGDSS